MNSWALTTVARLKTVLGISVSTYDSLLEMIIDSVTDFVENECDRRFKKTAYTNELMDGDGTKEIVLPQWPVDSSATFKIYKRDTVEYGDSNWDELDSDDYRVDYDSGVVRAGFRFYKGFQNYKFQFTAGYNFSNTGTLITLASVGLSDLEGAVWDLCATAFNKRKAGGDISRMKLYNYEVVFSEKANDEEIRKILDKYKRFNF